MNDLHWSRFSRTALSVAVAIVAAAPALAQNTTAAVGGRVLSPEGKPVAGAMVLIVHSESGSTNTLVTDAEGRYSVRGLRVGGPYVITVTKGGDTNQRQGVFLALAETTTIDLTVGQAQNQLAQVTISGTSSKINSATMGSGTNLSGQDLATQFSMQRNLQDYARLDPRIAQTNKENGEISAAGQNNRYNSITIDGVSISDTFGLEANNLPTMKQPVSMDAIDSVQINLSNYDVTQKGYTGANVNAVTKSGTNTFKGTVTYTYRDQDLAGRRWNRPPTDTFTRLSPFKEKLYGFTVGGPIVKDKLFFFAAYEEQHNTISSPAYGPFGSTDATAVNITRDQIASVQQIMKDVYKVDAGSLDNVSGLELSVKDALVKFDWNINEKHRANVRYTKTQQNEPTLPGFGTNELSLSSYWYRERKTIETVVAQLFSDWTEDFSTELKISNRDYEKATLSDTNLPQINVAWTNGGSRKLDLGTERSRHFNNLKTKTLDGYFAGNLFVGDHEIKGGADLSRNEIYNVFLQDTRGNYTFQGVPGTASDPLALLRNGIPTSYSVQLPFPGKKLEDSVANWTLSNIGFFLQDTWKVNKKLNITAGVRVDTVKTDDHPVANADAAKPLVPGNAATNTRQSGGFGMDNTANVDGQKLVQPRVGFNYQLDAVDQRKSQIRGGVGLFQGAAANVWLTNPYQNVGSTAVYNCGGTTNPCPKDLRFSPDGDHQPALTGTPQANVDFVEKGLSQPSVWKLNLAWDGQLPWYGLEAGVEWLHTKVKQGLYYQQLNLGTVTAYAPDGREMYYNAAGRSEACWTAGTDAFNSACGLRSKALSNASYNNVLLAASTNKGDGDTLTFQLSQRVNSNLRWSLAYTRTAATEVSPLASSVSSSSWNNRANFNPNENVAANSQYLIRDRISAAVNFSKAFVDSYKTTLGVFYEGRAGKPYSWVYRNDMNGDGRARNDLMYIPKAPGSGEVLFRLSGQGQTVANSGAAAEAAFWDVVNGDKALRNAKGGVVGRNSAFAPWVNNFDLRLSQEVRGFTRGGKGVITLDIMNVGNLLNRRWGQVSEAAFPSTRSFVNFAGITPDGKMVYAVATPDPLVTPTDAAGRTRLAQWGMNLTARYEF